LIEKDKITIRELVILEHLKRGLSNEKISLATGITINTVKFHLKKIYKKLHVINRVQAINKYNEIINKTF
jgi:DNA-binding CsgD family transcriptional regulator